MLLYIWNDIVESRQNNEVPHKIGQGDRQILLEALLWNGISDFLVRWEAFRGFLKQAFNVPDTYFQKTYNNLIGAFIVCCGDDRVSRINFRFQHSVKRTRPKLRTI